MLTVRFMPLWRALAACACMLAVAAPADRVARAASLFADGASSPFVSKSPAPLDEPAVRGLIVRLRDTPDHAATAAAMPDRRHAALARTGSRWHAVLQSTGLASEPGLRLEPVGRDAWRVVFDAARSRARVAAWATALAQRPEVQWAVPNERETALQAAPALPDDPLFGALDNEWWLLPPSGTNTDAPNARLRGVPGFAPAWARTTGSPAVVVAVLDSGISAHPDLDTNRLLPGYDMVSDWDATTGRGYANDGDGRDADPTDPGDWVDAADQAADPLRYADCGQQASDWHGTAVTGFLGATTNNATGVAAATWGVRVLPVRVAGKCGAEVADIVDGMRWAAGLQVCRTPALASDTSQTCAEWAPTNPTPARIVNISFGGTAACNAAYQDAIDELRALGVVVVAAGGNSHGAPTRPASCTGVVGVAALNRDGFKAAYSNFGAALKIATVGGDDTEGAWGALLTDGGLQSLGNDGTTVAGTPGYPHHFGTSFAAPIVSGVAALMLSADPSLTPDELIGGLQASARPHVASPVLPVCSAANPGRCTCTSETCGAGILDADQAVAFAQAHARGAAYVPPTWAVPSIDTAELRAAVALGADLAGTIDSSAGASGGGSTTAPTAPTTGAPTSGGGGGGAMAPLELVLLGLCGVLLGARGPRRAVAGRSGGEGSTRGLADEQAQERAED